MCGAPLDHPRPLVEHGGMNEQEAIGRDGDAHVIRLAGSLAVARWLRLERL